MKLTTIKSNGNKSQWIHQSSVLELMRNTKRFMRSSSIVAIIALVHGILFPHILMAKDMADEVQAEKQIVLTGTSAQQLNQALIKVQQLSDEKQQVIAERLAKENTLLAQILAFFGLKKLSMENVDDFKQLAEMLIDLDQQAIEQFAATEQQLIEKGLPATILDRHQATVSEYQEKSAALLQRLNETLAAEDLQQQFNAIDGLDNLMEDEQLEKTHQQVDPNNLPWGTPDASKTRKPVETSDDLSQRTHISPFKQATYLAANTLPDDIFALDGGPVPEDLAESVDVQITPAIRELAETQLKDDPVAIYNWVRNNIEFIPSYGSIQGSDYTLQNRKGNAFDTASLLISMLRASNIPARYAYGTIELPVEKVMNWVGGVEVPAAAQQLLGQGGIPNLALAKGGKITHIKMEHVWVEAWVDYFPSRGAKHKTGDQWIPLDASFKQYEYTQGTNLKDNVPFDAQALIDEIQQTATIDESEGSVQGVDQSIIETKLNAYKAELEAYINNQNPDATVGDVLGTQKIIIQEYRQLAAGLPYNLIARTNNYAELPDNLRHKISFIVENGSYGNTLIEKVISIPEIANKDIAFHYSPSKSEDYDVIASYYQNNDEIALPSKLPAYLIKVKPGLTIGEENYEGIEVSLGVDVSYKTRLYDPALGWLNSVVANGIAGEYRAFALNMNGVSPEKLLNLKNDIENISKDSDLFSKPDNLSKHKLIGLSMQMTLLNYFSLNDAFDKIDKKSSTVVSYSKMAFGYFHTDIAPTYFFGVPREVSLNGFIMDIPYLKFQSITKDNNSEKWIEYNQAKGFRASYMENWVPEQIFYNDGSKKGVSAAKLLNLASLNGQKIYKINIDNIQQLNNINIDSDSRKKILNSINVGKVVTVHESPITYEGWKGSGYVITDPKTGSGAYLISGNKNGSGIVDAILAAVATLLGFVDGKLEARGIKITKEIWFSEKLKYLQKLARASAVAGVLAFFASVFNAFRGQEAGWNQLGQISIAIFAFLSTFILVSSIATALGSYVILTGIVSALTALTIAVITSEFSKLYFTSD